MEIEASKEEQRGVVSFLVAEGAATRHKVKTPWNDVGGIILMHDNARPHTASMARDKLQHLRTDKFFPLVTFTFLAT